MLATKSSDRDGHTSRRVWIPAEFWADCHVTIVSMPPNRHSSRGWMGRSNHGGGCFEDIMAQGMDLELVCWKESLSGRSSWRAERGQAGWLTGRIAAITTWRSSSHRQAMMDGPVGRTAPPAGSSHLPGSDHWPGNMPAGAAWMTECDFVLRTRSVYVHTRSRVLASEEGLMFLMTAIHST